MAPFHDVSNTVIALFTQTAIQLLGIWNVCLSIFLRSISKRPEKPPKLPDPKNNHFLPRFRVPSRFCVSWFLPKGKLPSTFGKLSNLSSPFVRFICFLLFPCLFALWSSLGISHRFHPLCRRRRRRRPRLNSSGTRQPQTIN